MSSEIRPDPLHGAHKFLSLPSVFAGLTGATLGVLYGVATFDLGEAAGWFVAFAVIAFTTLTARTEYGNAKRLRILRQLAAGAIPTTRENLKGAAAVALRAADRIFLEMLFSWSVGPAWIGLMLKLVAGASWGLALRIAVFGLIFGPLTAALGHLMVVLRTRELLRQLSVLGLSAEDVRAVAPKRRLQTRGRLIVFTAITVFTPAVLAADLGLTMTRRGQAELAQLHDRAERAQAAARIHREAIAASGVLCALVLACSLFSAALAGKALGDPMRAIADEANRLSRGHFDHTPLIPAEDEIWEVCAAFSELQTNVVKVAGELNHAGGSIGSTAEEIHGTSDTFERATRDQAASLHQTSATTEELARSASQIAETAATVAEMAEQTLEAAVRGEEDAEAFAQSMARMRQDHRAIAEVVHKLAQRVQRIGKIVDFINTVADKSDLLALNGELEGTKAGEVGRSFSLVAQEMRRLAENILESTREIEELISEIRQATQGSVTATRQGLDASESGTRVVAAVSENLRQIAALAAQTSDAVRTISLATQQQQGGTSQLAMTMTDILRVTEQGKSTTEQVLSANQELSTVAAELKHELERLKVAKELG